MAKQSGLDEVHLINDLEANAHGIALLEESDLVVLNPGVPKAARESRFDFRRHRTRRGRAVS